MPTKDRLAELRAARASFRKDKDGDKENSRSEKRKSGKRRRRSKSDVDRPAEDLREFLSRMEEVSALTALLRDRTGELRRVQGRVVGAVRQDPEDQRRLARLVGECRDAAARARHALRVEQGWVLAAGEGADNYQLRRTQVRAQAGAFQEAWEGLAETQAAFQDRLKKMLVDRCRIAGLDVCEEDLEESADLADASSVFAGRLLRQEQAARRRLNDLEDRHGDFAKVESSLRELHEMFVDVSALVEDQGHVLDRIDANVAGGRENVESGAGELKQAKRSKSKARRRKVLLAVVVGAVVVAVVVVLVLL